jgi:hypothetical protein
VSLLSPFLRLILRKASGMAGTCHGRIARIRAIQCEVHHDETFP